MAGRSSNCRAASMWQQRTKTRCLGSINRHQCDAAPGPWSRPWLIHNNLSVGVFAANCDNFLLLVAVTSGGTGRLAAGMLVWLGRRVNAFHPSWFISRRRYQPSERPTIIESSKNAAVITTRQYNTILAHYTLDIQQF